jgi:hypothetical protein
MLLFQLNRCNTTPAPPCVRCWKLYCVSEQRRPRLACSDLYGATHKGDPFPRPYRAGDRVQFSAVLDLSLLHSVKTDPGSRPIGTGGLKRPVSGTITPPFSDDIKKRVAMPPLLHTPSWRSA